MGNNRNYNHQTINNHKSILLPMFCRLSITDVKLPIAAAEPSSPKVSCIGQVKRNNRVTGFPTTVHHHKHTRSKRVLCSTKTLLPNAATITSAKAAGGGGRSGIRSCRTNREKCENNRRRSRDCGKVAVDIGEMDPPLPVVKKTAPPGVGRDEVNIWKRRFNGVKSLQIEPIHLPNNKFQLPPTTV